MIKEALNTGDEDEKKKVEKITSEFEPSAESMKEALSQTKMVLFF